MIDQGRAEVTEAGPARRAVMPLTPTQSRPGWLKKNKEADPGFLAVASGYMLKLDLRGLAKF